MKNLVWLSVGMLVLVVILSVITAALPFLIHSNFAFAGYYLHIGAFTACLEIPSGTPAPCIPGKNLPFFTCASINHDCSLYDDAIYPNLKLSDCSQFNAVRAFLVIGIVTSFISLGLVVVALIFALRYSNAAGCLQLVANICNIVMCLCFFLSFCINMGYVHTFTFENAPDKAFVDSKPYHTSWTLLSSFLLSLTATIIYFICGKPEAEEPILGGLPTYLQY